MGASDSKLSFKQGIFRLADPKQIPADDAYWTGVGSPLAPWSYAANATTCSSGSCPSRLRTSSRCSRPQTFAAPGTATSPI